MTRWSAPAACALLALSACDAPPRAVPARFADEAARAEGRALFLEHCALCHGERADGRGVRRASLSSRPADFTDPFWSRRTSPERAFEIIRHGKPGTSMPAWPILTEDETWKLVAYLRAVAGESRR